MLSQQSIVDGGLRFVKQKLLSMLVGKSQFNSLTHDERDLVGELIHLINDV